MAKFRVKYFGSNDVPVHLIKPILDEIDAELVIARPSTDAEIIEAGRDADGIIMPAIITAHIAHSSDRCGTSQTRVIIQALAPVIGPYMSRAITTIHIQQTTGSRTRSAR